MWRLIHAPVLIEFVYYACMIPAACKGAYLINTIKMGINTSNLQQFRLKYQISTHCYRKKNAKQLGDTYQAVTIYNSSPVDSQRLNTFINHRQDWNSRYLVLPHQIYHSNSNQSPHPSYVLVYQQTGINLAMAMSKRAQQGSSYSEADVSYFLECVLRGLREYNLHGIQYELFTAHALSIDRKSYLVKLIDQPLISQNKGMTISGVYGSQGSISPQILAMITSKWQGILRQQDDTPQSLSTSLLALGLISLCMLDCAVPLQQFFVAGERKMELDRKIINQRICMIQDEGLKWKIWLLLSEYPQQRKEVYQQLSEEFDIINYPVQILNRKTTIEIDLKQQHADRKISKVRCHTEQPHFKEVQQPTMSRTSTAHQGKFFPAPSKNKRQSWLNQPAPPVVLTQSVFIKPVPSITTRPSIMSPQHQSVPSYQIHSQKRSQSQILPSKNSFSAGHIISNPTLSVPKLIDSLPVLSGKSPQTNFTYNPLLFCQAENSKAIFSAPSCPLEFPQKLDQMYADEEESIVVGSHYSENESSEARPADIDDIWIASREHSPCSSSPVHSLNDEELEANVFEQEMFDKKIIPRISPIVSCSNSVIREQSMSLENSFSREQVSVQYVLEECQEGSYEGYKSNGIRQGYGKLIYKTGEVYEGDWKANNMHGQGRLYYQVGVLAYEGRWYKNRFHGRGRFLNCQPQPLKKPFDYRDMSKVGGAWMEYDGEFVSDQKWGEGKLTFQNGQTFNGRWREDLPQGKGVFMSAKKGCVRGVWRSGILTDLL